MFERLKILFKSVCITTDKVSKNFKDGKFFPPYDNIDFEFTHEIYLYKYRDTMKNGLKEIGCKFEEISDYSYRITIDDIVIERYDGIGTVSLQLYLLCDGNYETIYSFGVDYDKIYAHECVNGNYDQYIVDKTDELREKINELVVKIKKEKEEQYKEMEKYLEIAEEEKKKAFIKLNEKYKDYKSVKNI